MTSDHDPSPQAVAPVRASRKRAWLVPVVAPRLVPPDRRRLRAPRQEDQDQSGRLRRRRRHGRGGAGRHLPLSALPPDEHARPRSGHLQRGHHADPAALRRPRGLRRAPQHRARAGQVLGDLCRTARPTRSSSGTTPGFHNGRRVTAEDCVYSFERLLTAGVNDHNYSYYSRIQGAEDFRTGRRSHVAGLEALSEDRFRAHVRLALRARAVGPGDVFVQDRAQKGARIRRRGLLHTLPSVRARSSSRAGSTPKRTPSVPVERGVRQGIRFEANPQYFDGRPHLDALVFRALWNSQEHPGEERPLHEVADCLGSERVRALRGLGAGGGGALSRVEIPLLSEPRRSVRQPQGAARHQLRARQTELSRHRPRHGGHHRRRGGSAPGHPWIHTQGVGVRARRREGAAAPDRGGLPGRAGPPRALPARTAEEPL